MRGEKGRLEFEIKNLKAEHEGIFDEFKKTQDILLHKSEGLDHEEVRRLKRKLQKYLSAMNRIGRSIEKKEETLAVFPMACV